MKFIHFYSIFVLIIIPFIYNDAYPTGNYLSVKKDGKWGLIDLNNKIILPYEYTYIAPLNEKSVWVSKKENGEDVYEVNLTTYQKAKQ